MHVHVLVLLLLLVELCLTSPHGGSPISTATPAERSMQVLRLNRGFITRMLLMLLSSW